MKSRIDYNNKDNIYIKSKKMQNAESFAKKMEIIRNVLNGKFNNFVNDSLDNLVTLKEGTKVKLNYDSITNEPSYKNKTKKYKNFVEKNKNKIFTVEYDEKYKNNPILVCLKEDKDTDKPTLLEIKKTASKMVADIPFSQTIRTFAGVRPTPKNHDFIIEESRVKDFIDVAGIEVGGNGASLAAAVRIRYQRKADAERGGHFARTVGGDGDFALDVLPRKGGDHRAVYGNFDVAVFVTFEYDGHERGAFTGDILAD